MFSERVGWNIYYTNNIFKISYQKVRKTKNKCKNERYIYLQKFRGKLVSALKMRNQSGFWAMNYYQGAIDGIEPGMNFYF